MKSSYKCLPQHSAVVFFPRGFTSSLLLRSHVLLDPDQENGFPKIVQVV